MESAACILGYHPKFFWAYEICGKYVQQARLKQHAFIIIMLSILIFTGILVVVRFLFNLFLAAYNYD